MNKSEKPDIKRGLETSRGLLHFTTHKLLEETEKRPILWNKKDPNYKNRKCIDEAWYDITRVFVPYFDELDDDEKFNLSEVLRKRYHSCVSQLNISIKNINDPKYRPFMYAKQMNFYLKMRGYKLEDLYDEKQVVDIVKIENPLQNKNVGAEEDEIEDDGLIDEVELQLRKELGEDDEGDDEEVPVNENAVSSSKKAKTAEPNAKTRSPRMGQKRSLAKTSQKEPKPTSTTSTNNRGQLKKSRPNVLSPNVSDERASQSNEEEEEEFVEYHEVEDKIDYIEEDHDPEDDFITIQPLPQQKQQKPKNSKIVTNINVAAASPAANASNKYESESDYADQAFFESIKPVVRRMNESQKLDFKIDVLQILRSFRTN